MLVQGRLMARLMVMAALIVTSLQGELKFPGRASALTKATIDPSPTATSWMKFNETLIFVVDPSESSAVG